MKFIKVHAIYDEGQPTAWASQFIVGVCWVRELSCWALKLKSGHNLAVKESFDEIYAQLKDQTVCQN